MIHPHFNLQFVGFLASHREIWLTRFFLLASYFGAANFYFFLTLLLYVAWDKRLAIRLSVLVLAALSLMGILKIFIGNLRPFVKDGTYLKKWAVSPRQAKTLAAEYSTPSGHAMGSAAFYSYLFALTRKRALRILFVVTILCIGFSRPYLGVHYGEDVLMGWAIGLSMALVAIFYANRLAELWAKMPYALQITAAVLATVGIWALTAALNGGRIESQVQDQDAYGGFLTGIAIACPLEMRLVNFDSRSGSLAHRSLRFAVSVALMGLVLFPLQLAFAPLAARSAVLGCALSYLRYTAAEVCVIFLAPFAFCKMGLATQMKQVNHLAKAAREE
jgi:membrane-associated phospholipid phosphatase